MSKSKKYFQVVSPYDTEPVPSAPMRFRGPVPRRGERVFFENATQAFYGPTEYIVNQISYRWLSGTLTVFVNVWPLKEPDVAPT